MFNTNFYRLEHIYIKGSFGTDSGAQVSPKFTSTHVLILPLQTQLGPMSMGSGKEVNGAVEESQQAAGVEQCRCPEGYFNY